MWAILTSSRRNQTIIISLREGMASKIKYCEKIVNIYLLGDREKIVG